MHRLNNSGTLKGLENLPPEYLRGAQASRGFEMSRTLKPADLEEEAERIRASKDDD